MEPPKINTAGIGQSGNVSMAPGMGAQGQNSASTRGGNHKPMLSASGVPAMHARLDDEPEVAVPEEEERKKNYAYRSAPDDYADTGLVEPPKGEKNDTDVYKVKEEIAQGMPGLVESFLAGERMDSVEMLRVAGLIDTLRILDPEGADEFLSSLIPRQPEYLHEWHEEDINWWIPFYWGNKFGYLEREFGEGARMPSEMNTDETLSLLKGFQGSTPINFLELIEGLESDEALCAWSDVRMFKITFDEKNNYIVDDMAENVGNYTRAAEFAFDLVQLVHEGMGFPDSSNITNSSFVDNFINDITGHVDVDHAIADLITRDIGGYTKDGKEIKSINRIDVMVCIYRPYYVVQPGGEDSRVERYNIIFEYDPETSEWLFAQVNGEIMLDEYRRN